MNPKAALKLIKDIGIYGLGCTDGCLCTSFEVKGVTVDISCYKSAQYLQHIAPHFYGNVIRVYCNPGDANDAALEPIAQEVARQLKNESDAEILVRYADFTTDHARRTEAVE